LKGWNIEHETPKGAKDTKVKKETKRQKAEAAIFYKGRTFAEKIASGAHPVFVDRILCRLQ